MLSPLRLSKKLIVPGARRHDLAERHRVRRKPGYYAGQAVTYKPVPGQLVTDTIVEMHGHLAELDKGKLVPIRELTLVVSDEEWKPVEGFDGRYIVSSHGKVVSTEYQRTARERLLRYVTGPGGRLEVSLVSKQARIGVGRLVALHFNPAPDPASKQVIPKDGNPLNLRANNQKWLLAGEELDPEVNYRGRAGSGHHKVRLSDEQAEAVRRAYAAGGVTHAELAERCGVARVTITKLINQWDQDSGQRRPSPRLCSAQIAELRMAHAEGTATLVQLAERFNVSRATIGRFVNDAERESGARKG